MTIKKKYRVLEDGVEIKMPQGTFKWDKGAEPFIVLEEEAERLLAEGKVEFIEEVEVE